MIAVGLVAAMELSMENTLRAALDFNGYAYESVACTPAGNCTIEARNRTTVLNCDDYGCVVISVKEKFE